jgi:SAM-dependent methyltransferase
MAATAPGPQVLDVGCGTGIVSRQLQAAGCTVLGIDPDARMAGLAERTGIDTEVAKFEDWDSADRTFDAVVAGQTWHWVDPVAGTAKAVQVLRPNGLIALFWNVHQPPPDVVPGFAEAYRRAIPDTPAAKSMGMPSLDVYSVMFDKTGDAIRGTGSFSEPAQWRYEWDQVYTRDDWLDQVPTFGGFSTYTSEAQRLLLDGIGTAIDAVGGSFTMKYTTVAVTATLTKVP